MQTCRFEVQEASAQSVLRFRGTDGQTVLQNLGVIDEANWAPYLAQAFWLAVRLQLPPQDGVANAAVLLHAIGLEAPAAPLLAAAAVWLTHRPDAGEQEEWQDQALAMLAVCGEKRGIATDELKNWLEREGLLDPARFLPELDRALEELVGNGGWLFDRSAWSSKRWVAERRRNSVSSGLN